MSATMTQTTRPPVRYFRVLVACGHVGPRQEVTVARYFEAKDAMQAFRDAARMPRVKLKDRAGGVLSVQEISRAEWEAGIAQEAEDPYLTANGGTKRTYGRGL